MLVILVLLIFALSVLFSMLGLGGAMVYNPLMVWFGYDFKSVVAPTGLLLNALTAASAAWVYYRNRLINFSVGIPLTVAATLGAPLGAWFTAWIPTRTLLFIFSWIVALTGLRMLLQSQRPEANEPRGTPKEHVLVGVMVGLGVGALAGMLGIGGGFLFVPLLLQLGYPTKVAAATTALAVVFSSFSGLLGHLAAGHWEPRLMLWASIAVLVGSQIGARVMTHRMKGVHLKRMFGIVLLFIAAKLLWGLL